MPRYTRYNRDPRRIKVRYAGHCAGCGAPLPKGADAFYYPSTKSLYCEKQSCGGKASAEFQAAAEDEAFMQSQFPGGYEPDHGPGCYW